MSSQSPHFKIDFVVEKLNYIVDKQRIGFK